MKKTILFLLALLAFGLPAIAAATPASFTGSFRGMAYEWTRDLTGNGAPGRTFDLHTINDGHFDHVGGVVDTSLVAFPGQGTCGNPNAFELLASGIVVFSAKDSKDAVYAEIDESMHLCFVPGQDEHVALAIIGGHGSYAGATGSGTVTLNDVVLKADPITMVPLVVHTTGDFTLDLE